MSDTPNWGAYNQSLAQGTPPTHYYKDFTEVFGSKGADAVEVYSPSANTKPIFFKANVGSSYSPTDIVGATPVRPGLSNFLDCGYIKDVIVFVDPTDTGATANADVMAQIDLRTFRSK